MDLYKEEVMEHYNHPRNRGKMSGKDVLTGHENNASCGDRVEFYLKTQKGIIVEVKWEGAGCAITTASASKLSEWLEGKSIQGLKELSEESFAKEGVGFEVNVGRMKCLMLPVTAVKKVLGN
jgi:nitrogen fixation NifU-like protein